MLQAVQFIKLYVAKEAVLKIHHQLQSRLSILTIKERASEAKRERETEREKKRTRKRARSSFHKGEKCGSN